MACPIGCSLLDSAVPAKAINKFFPDILSIFLQSVVENITAFGLPLVKVPVLSKTTV